MGLVVLAIVTAAAIAVTIVARMSAGEERSIVEYRSGLESLRGAAARARGPTPTQSRGSVEAGRSPDSTSPTPAPSPLLDRSSPSALRPRRRAVRRQVAAAATGVVVVVSLAAVVIRGANTSSESSEGPPATSSSTTTDTSVATTPPTSVPVVIPESADEQEVVFATGPSVAVLIVASGPCWVGVRGGDGAEGFEGILQPGDQQQIEGAIPLQVRLGNPTAVEVFVNGVPAQVPAEEGTPLDLIFGGV